MKVTAALKKELTQWFEAFWSTYLKGDIDTWATFIRDDYRNIGGTEAELWNSKQEIIEYTNTIMDQFLGTADIRNREIEVIPYGDYLMVHEFTDLYVKIDGKWTLYAPFRMSSLMEKTDTGWITFHQHGSYPDMKALEGEAFSIDALKAENIKLQEGIKARTLELEEKNRELEIEAALERIRSRSMAMHSTNELSDVILVLFKQFELLGIVIDTCYIDIFDKDNQSFNVYIGTGTAIYPEQVNIPYSNHPIHQLNKRAREDNLEFFTFDEDKKSKDMYFEHFYPNAKGIKVPEERKALIAKGLGMTGSTALGEQSGIAIFNYRKIIYSKEENDILVRVNKVFQQTYTRFLDLQKAEKQAKEAKIEAALERIRASTMAMHKSHELARVVKQINRELLNLNINLDNTQILTDLTNDPQKGFNIWIAVDGMDYLHKFRFPYLNHAVTHRVYKNQEKQIAFYSDQVGKEEKNSYFKLVYKYSDFKTIPKERQKIVFDAPGWTRGIVFLTNSVFVLSRFKKEAFNEEETEIFLRVGKVFEQAYTRFLDLQKVEKQAKEAKIEAALERIRASTMAMHKSHELAGVVKRINKELLNLNIHLDTTQILTDITNDPQKGFNIWIAVDGVDYLHKFHFPYIDHAITQSFYKNQEKQIAFYSEHFGEEEKNSYFKLVFKYSDFKTIPKDRQKRVFDAPGWTRGIVFLTNSILILSRYKKEAFNEEETEIFVRIGKVFEQAYTRFLDLRKAEAQAREAQIETAMEKVRASSMSIQKSDELIKVVQVVNKEIKGLGIDVNNTQIITDFTDQKKGLNIWFVAEGEDYLEKFHLNYIKHAISDKLISATKNGTAFYKEIYSKKEKNEFLKLVFQSSDFINIPKERQELLYDAPGLVRAVVLSENSIIVFQRYYLSEFTKEQEEIFKRFGKVFEQAYTRFLDLKKAEAQTREAQIEASLERVRSASMAMHNSTDLKNVITAVFEQMEILEIPTDSAQIVIHKKGSKDLNLWAYSPGEDFSEQINIPYRKNPVFDDYWNNLNRGPFSMHYTKLQKDEFYQTVFMSLQLRHMSEERKKLVFDAAGMNRAFVAIDKAGITILNYRNIFYSQEVGNILVRLLDVFNQAYTRFLDLQKAENQARESQIEAALERVRSQAMAMHHTDDLSYTIEAFYEQLSSLIDSKVVRCGAGLLSKETTMGEIISASCNSNGEIYSIQGSIDMIGLPILDNTYKAWLRQKEYHHILKGNEIKAYYQHMTNQLALPDNNTDDELHFYFPMFAEGSFYMVTESALPNEELAILRRFSSVLSLTYRRFNDLQKAEAREKEAIKQASLDRVRGEIASMRTAKDLERITPLVWKELTALGVPFFRCGVFIIREDEEMVHAYLSTPDGKSVAALHLPFSDRDTQLIKPAVDNWRKQKPYKEEWDQEQFVQQTRSFMEKGQIENPQSYQVMDTPPERLVLHLVPFRQGMLYVGHSEDLNEEQLALVESLALTFSVAYSRYEDFKALEDTKNSLELTLRDLKSTQTQLIQAEKMASLGELTAGIAHEIQNPLNFVNNFSEVSKELLEEMLEDLKNGDIEEVDAIASDVIANLEKILHHGQRADGIVKGMLQHSRSNSGKKELTDINQLVDEYLRLAYHGLRAKDKSFNASLETDFDDSIEQQEFIAQDIGRVVLNLITNAFYACNQKKKILDDSEAKAFQPTVKVSSKNLKDHLEISVEDNGNGIPKHIIDKIFQPFFTTKPTGEGTGLGLSLSYDIIKAHGGTLYVESEEEKGTRFTINLPVNS